MDLAYADVAAVAAQDVMEGRARVFAVALGLIVLLVVINLVRTRRLTEEFALLWFVTAVVLVLTPLFIDYVDMAARAIGIAYPPAMIFLLAIISLLLILFQFSMRMSRFSDQIKVLTQEVALLNARLEDLGQRGAASSAGSDQTAAAPPKVTDDHSEIS